MQISLLPTDQTGRWFVETGDRATSGERTWVRYDVDGVVELELHGRAYRLAAVYVDNTGDVSVWLAQRTKTGRDFKNGSGMFESLATLTRQAPELAAAIRLAVRFPAGTEVHPFAIGDRVVRISDGATGTVDEIGHDQDGPTAGVQLDDGTHCGGAASGLRAEAATYRCVECGEQVAVVDQPAHHDERHSAPAAKDLTAGATIRHENVTVTLTADARPFTTYGGRPAIRLSGTTADGVLWTGDADPDTAVELVPRTVDLHDLLDPTTPATGVPLEHVAATILGWYEADAPAADDCDVLAKAEEFQAALLADDLVTAAELAGEIGVGYDLHPA